MTVWLSAGIIFTLLSVAYILVKWGNMKVVGVTPVRTFTFIAILFTSGLDVGLIMFPLTEFAGYADISASPEYAFTNPLAIEFGFWGFLMVPSGRKSNFGPRQSRSNLISGPWGPNPDIFHLFGRFSRHAIIGKRVLEFRSTPPFQNVRFSHPYVIQFS